MTKYKVVFEDYITESHKEAVITLLNNVHGIAVLEKGSDSEMHINVTDEMTPIITDMILCDYISAIKESE